MTGWVIGNRGKTGPFDLMTWAAVTTRCVNGKMYDGRTVILAAGVSRQPGNPRKKKPPAGKRASLLRQPVTGSLTGAKRIADYLHGTRVWRRRIEISGGLAAEGVSMHQLQGCGVRRDNVRHTVGYAFRNLGENRLSGLVPARRDGGRRTGISSACVPAWIPAALLPELKGGGGHIQVDRSSRTESFRDASPPGTATGRPYQYAKAVGRGQRGPACKRGGIF